MLYDYRGWRISVVAGEDSDGWFASSTVREPGAHRSTPARQVVPPVTAETREAALRELVRRTHAWIDRYGFGES